jgi:type III secretion protein S
MGDDQVQHLMRETLLLVMWLSLPVLGVAACVGLVIGLLQAVTQIQDQSLPQVVKLLAVLVTLVVLGPVLAPPLLRHTENILDQIPAISR